MGVPPPARVACWIVSISTTGFAVGLRGLKGWYQGLVAFFTILALAGLFLTNKLDPGAVTPVLEIDPVILRLNCGEDFPGKEKFTRSVYGNTWDKLTDVPGQVLKYCPTCNVWRDVRDHHCTTCCVCVDNFDHHCEVVGNCVAKHTHIFFAGFLLACQVACGLMFGGVVFRLQELSFPMNESLKNGETYVLLVLGIIYGVHVLFLVFGDLHCWAVVADTTTKDCLRGTTLRNDLPCFPGRRNFKSLLRSWRAVCCGPFRWRKPIIPISSPPVIS